MIDLLYSRYGSGARDIFQTEFEIGLEIIATSQRNQLEEKIFQRWVNGWQFSVSYDDFEREIIGLSGYNIYNSEPSDIDGIMKTVKDILDMER